MTTNKSPAIGTPHAAARTFSRGKQTVANALTMLTFALLFYPLDLSRPAESISPATTPTHNAHELPHFDAVHSYLLRGGAPTREGLKELKDMGVKTIIDLRRSEQNIKLEAFFADQLGLKYVSLPMGNFIPSNKKLGIFTRIVDAAAADPANAPVFVHCSHGSDRTSFMVALWRVQHDHWPIAQAAAEMIQQGFIVHKFRKDDINKPMFD